MVVSGIAYFRLGFLATRAVFLPGRALRGFLAEGEARSAGYVAPSPVVPRHRGLILEGQRLAGLALLMDIVRKARQVRARQCLSDEPLNILDQRNFAGGHERKGVSDFPGARGSPCTMDVVLRIFRHVEVDHMCDARDIESPRSDIRRHENTVSAALEIAQCFFPLALAPV